MILVVAMASALAGCGLMASDMKAYPGPDLSKSQLAVVENAWGCPGCLTSVRNEGYVYYDISCDGMRSSVSLQPGAYDIAYGHRNYKTTAVERSDRIELKAGHTYVVKDDVCYAFCFSMPSYQTFVWIEDGASGEVVSGIKP